MMDQKLKLYVFPPFGGISDVRDAFEGAGTERQATFDYSGHKAG